MAGLTNTGFEPKTGEEVFSDIETDLKSDFGANFDTTEKSPAGLILGIVSEQISNSWDLLDSIYRSLDPDQAEGLQQDYAYALVNVQRLQAVKSIVEAVTLTNNTLSPCTVPAGSLVRQSSTLKEWETLSEVVIPASGTVNVDVQCTEYGAITASVGSIDTIVNPIAGWDEVTNTNTEIIGRDEESNEDYRIRRETSLTTAQGGTCPAIKDRLINDVDGVTYVSYRENRTDTTDGNGLPPHSFEMIVEGGTDPDVASKILETGPAGIETYGTETESVTDSEGNVYQIKFSRITEVPIYLIVNLVTNGDYPVDGDDQVKALLVTFFDTFERGQDVLNWRLDSAFKDIEGITGVTSILQGTAPAPGTSANITINNNQRATLSLANITVNS